MTEWKNFTTYILTVKTQGLSPGCVLRRSMVITTLGDDCLLRMLENYSTFRKVRTWRILIQVIKRKFCYFSQRSIRSTYRHRSVFAIRQLTPFLLQINKTNVKSLNNYWLKQNVCMTYYKLFNVLDTFILLN